MDDMTVTQLFAKMDAHLDRQDAHLDRQDAERRAILETLAQQNAVLADLSQMLATTATAVAAIHAEASRQHAATMAAFDALLDRLRAPRPDGDGPAEAPPC